MFNRWSSRVGLFYGACQGRSEARIETTNFQELILKQMVSIHPSHPLPLRLRYRSTQRGGLAQDYSTINEVIMFPEITVTELSEKLKSGEKFILLDVRELVELNQAKIPDSRLEVASTSRLAQEGVNALSESARSKDATIYIICHHGNRSKQVTMWLAQQGWKNVFNVRGGIDEYARKVDKTVGMY